MSTLAQVGTSSVGLPVIMGADLVARGTSVVRDEADVVVIGSGCGGATVAARLAEAGKRVIVVEQGGYYGATDFDQRERHMLKKIDGQNGLDTSVDGGIAFTYGGNVGGASVHYWADSFRTPPDRLALWQERFGIEGHDAQTLAPHFATLERDHNVHVVDDDGYVNAMNAHLRDAARALGWRVEKVPQARRGCARSGHCMQGCAYDAKQSQLVTHIPRLLAAGGRLYSDVRALTLSTSTSETTPTATALTGTSRTLHCRVLDRASGGDTGVSLVLSAKAFVVAAGGLATPEFLLRQAGLKERLPHVGEHFFCNPCAQAHAIFDHDIIQWRNLPAAWGVEHFRTATIADGAYVEGGYLLMANQLHPATLAACLLLDGARQREVFAHYKQLGGTIAWIDDADSGRVWLEGDRRRVSVPLDGENGKRLRDAWRKQARLLFAAGAREVFFGDVHDTRIAAGASDAAIDAAVSAIDIRPARNVFAAPHPGGGARMGRDATTSVVGSDHRVHGSDNVYVADPSVFPTPPSVDPSLTIMAFAGVAADVIASRV